MQKDENLKNDESLEQEADQGGADNTSENAQNTAENAGSSPDVKYAELNDKYLRLYSDFDNYRKRTIKERAELIKTAGEEIFKAILPVIDDFERAIKANEKVEDPAGIKEGLQLIYNKLKKAVEQKGLQSFETAGKPFDADLMEAITRVPSEQESGVVIDEVEKGYKLGDKVIRFAKVVVAQ